MLLIKDNDTKSINAALLALHNEYQTTINELKELNAKLTEQTKKNKDSAAKETGNLEEEIEEVKENYLPLSGGTMTGSIITSGNDIVLGTGPDRPDDSGDIEFLYSNDQEKARIYTPNDISTSGGLLKYRSYKSDGTQIKNSYLATQDSVDQKLPLAGGTMTGKIIGNTGNGLEVQSSNTGGWKEGIRIYDNTSNGYSVVACTNADASDLVALVHNGLEGQTSHEFYLETRKDGGGNRIIDIPNKSGTMALTSDIPSKQYYQWATDGTLLFGVSAGSTISTVTFITRLGQLLSSNEKTGCLKFGYEWAKNVVVTLGSYTFDTNGGAVVTWQGYANSGGWNAIRVTVLVGAKNAGTAPSGSIFNGQFCYNGSTSLVLNAGKWV